MVGLSEVRWLGKNEIVSENCILFYLGEAKAKKNIAVVLINDIVRRVRKVEN